MTIGTGCQQPLPNFSGDANPDLSLLVDHRVRSRHVQLPTVHVIARSHNERYAWCQGARLLNDMQGRHRPPPPGNDPRAREQAEIDIRSTPLNSIFRART